MAYTINLTNGGIYAVIPDGQINETNDALTLVGKNFTGYGENIGENFVHLLENSADATFPGIALTGQLWFDTTAGVLKVYAGNLAGWKSLGGTAPTATEPSADKSEVGDIWFDTATEQTYIYNSTEYILINQVGPVSAGETGPISTNNDGHEIVEYWVNGELVAIMSKDASFTPSPAITGFATIEPGFQLSTTVSSGNAVFTGTATNAQLLDNIDSTGFLSAIDNDTTAGALGIVNDGGLTFGLNSDGQLKIVSSDVVLRNVTLDGDMQLQVNSGGSTVAPLWLDGVSGRARVLDPLVDADIANWGYTRTNTVEIVSGQALAPIGSVAAPGYSFVGDTNTGIYQTGTNANAISFATAGTNRLTIESNGTLNVAGTVNYETLVTTDDDIPNKKFIDDTYLSLAGNQTLTGNLDMYDFSPELRFRTTSDGGYSNIQFKDQDNFLRSKITGTTLGPFGTIRFDIYDEAGVFTGRASVEDDGNVRTDAPAPTEDYHLTRRDYVNGLITAGEVTIQNPVQIYSKATTANGSQNFSTTLSYSGVPGAATHVLLRIRLQITGITDMRWCYYTIGGTLVSGNGSDDTDQGGLQSAYSTVEIWQNKTVTNGNFIYNKGGGTSSAWIWVVGWK